MKQKNARSLDAIADNINQLSRRSVVDIGELLAEARAQCEHGQWTTWLWSNFEWSQDTAERYMKVAELSVKFRNLRNLRLAKTTLYQLADHEAEEDLPGIIAELAKHVRKTRLVPRDAERVIKIGIGRRRFGDHPDATLAALVDLDERSGEIWHQKAVAALLEREPTTDESANAIIDGVETAISRDLPEGDTRNDEVKHATDEEIEEILGTPPELPPPTKPPEPQKLSAETAWPETEQFAEAVTDLRELRGKPVARFVGRFTSAELREVADFLTAVAAADKGKAA